MSFFRKHIIRYVTILIIQVGFIFCLIPIEQKNHTNKNFSEWLSNFIKGKPGNQIQKQVHSLGYTNDDISQVMTRASELISKHADRFDIPLKKADPSETDVYKVLYVEWNLYHQSTASTSMVVLDHTKNQTLFNQEKRSGSPSFAAILPHQKSPVYHYKNFSERSAIIANQTICPLISGIAIGAP